ncbi:hypothetical protein EV122DRAFT_220324 [Schizophyllum commune]
MQLPASCNRVECSVVEFYKACVETKGYARVSDCAMSCIMESLRDRGAIDRFSGQWTDMPVRHFLTVAADDVMVFAHVLAAAADVLPGRCKTDKKVSKFVCCLDCQTASGVSSIPFHVDALSYLREPTYTREAEAGTAHNYTASAPGRCSTIYTADVGVTWGFKLWDDESSVLRNESHALSTAQHMLHNDLRRTCHFSCTIERTTARIWCHTRSGTIVTRGFDLHKDAEELVQFILFSAFATPSQLGFDPTVRRVVVNNKLHYTFDVVDIESRHRTYRSVAIEHENPAAELHGRAMRVFKVVVDVECGVEHEHGHEFVLRDYLSSYDDSSSEEWRIQREILEQLEAKLSKEDFAEARQHFMTMLADGPVCPDDNCGESAACAGLERSSHIPLSRKPLDLQARRHCRTVYLEHCQDLWQMKDPAKFYFALGQLMYTLNNFRRAGYMHRDISPGNVMLQALSTASEATCLSEQYITKVADLEYAKAYSRTRQDDPITGTALFMSVELQARAHQFRNKKIKGLLTSSYFAYSFLHDVESVLWMALYFTYRRCSRAILENTPWNDLRPRLEAARTYAAEIFIDNIRGSQQRDNVFTEPYNAENIVLLHFRGLYGDDSPMTKLAGLIDALRETYEAVENDTTVLCAGNPVRSNDPNAPRLAVFVYEKNAQIYDTMAQVFYDISQHFYSAENTDALVQFSDIDFTTGKIIVKPAAPTPVAAPVATVADGAAAEAGDGQATGAPKKLTGKRKKDAEDEARGKKRASAKRSGADASAQRAGTAGPSGSQPATRGKTRAKSNTKPAAAGKRSSGRSSGRLSKRNSAQDPA